MPRDSSGVFTLVPGYEAITGETIQPSQHNPPLEDIASALTGSLPRNGSAPMLGALKLADGSASAPSLAFNTALGTGLFLVSPTVIGLAIGGVLVTQFTASGIAGTVTVGAGMDFWGDTPDSGWLFAYGQAISRTTYAALFAKFGTKYGVGDGTTTFNMPDKRGRSSFGKDDMGGTSANRITGQSGGWNGDTLGAAGGAETHELSIAELASHNHTGTAVAVGNHAHSVNASGSNVQVSTSTLNATVPLASNNNTGDGGSHGHTLSINNTGSGQAHNNLPPGISCNYIIYTGV